MADWALDASLWAAHDQAANAPILHQLNASNRQMAAQILMNLQTTSDIRCSSYRLEQNATVAAQIASRPHPQMSVMGKQTCAIVHECEHGELLRELTHLRQQTREMRIELHRLKQVDAVAVAERAEGVALN